MKKHIPSIARRLFLCIMAEQHNNTHIKRILKKRRAWKNCWINKNKISNNFNSRQNSPHVSTLHSTIIYTTERTTMHDDAHNILLLLCFTLFSSFVDAVCCFHFSSWWWFSFLCFTPLPLLRRFWKQVLASCMWKAFSSPFPPPTQRRRQEPLEQTQKKHHKSLHYALLFCVFCCAHCSSILFIHF